MAEEAKKTPRGSKKPKPDAVPMDTAEVNLSEQVAQLSAMVTALQAQIVGAAPAQVAPPSEPVVSVAPVAPLAPEPAPQPIEELSSVEDESTAIFKEFDEGEFAADLAEAMANQVPIDWSLLAEVPEEDSESDLSIEEEELLVRAMVQNHPEMVEGIVEYNDTNPPDFVVEDALWRVLKDKELDQPTLGGKPLFDPSVLDDLMEEANQAEASNGGEEDFEFDLSQWEVTKALSQAGATAEREPEPMPVHYPVSGSHESEAAAAVPAHLAIRALALPVQISEGEIVCRVAKPFDEEALTELEEAVGLKIIREPYPLLEVVKGLREVYAEPLDGKARLELLEGAAPRPGTWVDKVLAWTGLRQAS